MVRIWPATRRHEGSSSGGIRYTRRMTRYPSTVCPVDRFPVTRGAWLHHSRAAIVRKAIFLDRFGLLFKVLRRSQLRVTCNGAADLPRSRRPVAGLAFNTEGGVGIGTLPWGRRLLCARANEPATNDY